MSQCGKCLELERLIDALRAENARLQRKRHEADSRLAQMEAALTADTISNLLERHSYRCDFVAALRRAAGLPDGRGEGT